MAERKISLRAARVNAGFSQKQAAERLGLNPATLRSYECGRRVPGWDVVQAIERLYAFPAANIFFASKFALSEEDSEPAR